jgi:hypothetical protein
VSAILRLRRQGVGIELRRGTFDIEIDGEQAGSIDWDQSTEIPIEPGHHGLQMRAGRYSSRVHPFEVIEGGVANFRCHGAMMWPRYVASIFQPNLAISLIHE